MFEIPRKLRIILLIVGILLFIGAAVVYPYGPVWSIVMFLVAGVLILTGINSTRNRTMGVLNTETVITDTRIANGSPRVYQDKPVNPWDTVSTDKPAAPTPEREYTSTGGPSVEKQLEKLEAQYEAGLCGKEEYQARRREILKKP